MTFKFNISVNNVNDVIDINFSRISRIRCKIIIYVKVIHGLFFCTQIMKNLFRESTYRLTQNSLPLFERSVRQITLRCNYQSDL